jgi:hypothetical protein
MKKSQSQKVFSSFSKEAVINENQILKKKNASLESEVIRLKEHIREFKI